MDPTGPGGRAQLRAIARRAMTERGLEPDFPPQVLAELAALGERPVETGPGLRDLRALAWVSIDDADTRDLDQLSVTEPLDQGAVKLLVAVADVDTVWESRRSSGAQRSRGTAAGRSPVAGTDRFVQIESANSPASSASAGVRRDSLRSLQARTRRPAFRPA